MFSDKRVNIGVVKMYKGIPYIETTVTFVTPLDKDSDLYKGLAFNLDKIKPVMSGLIDSVEGIIGDTFEADVKEIHCGIANFFK